MSLYFDFVISCDLREDTPEEAINAIRCLTSRDYELSEKPHLRCDYYDNIWDSFWDKHFLAPDPEHEVISTFQKMLRLTIPLENDRKVYRYSLQFSGRNIHDDYFYAHHVPLFYWLPSIVEEENTCIGYVMETDGHRPDLFIVEHGKLIGDKFNPVP